jgi:tRNA(fMet)-specific endonuclease VapC
MLLQRNASSEMPGKRYLLDTNALVALLRGHEGLTTIVSEAQWLGVSVVNVLEFLGFNDLSDADRALFLELTSRLVVVDLNFSEAELMQEIILLRKTRTVKLPDAIVMASATLYKATLVTNDAVLLKLSAAASGNQALAF